MVAKLIGMLGSDHDGECLNAARLLKRRMNADGMTFGDLSNIIAGNDTSTKTVYVNRTVNPAAELCREVLKRGDKNLAYSERKFLNEMIRKCEMTGRKFELSSRQADWLRILHDEHCKAKANWHHEPPAREDATFHNACDELGL